MKRTEQVKLHQDKWGAYICIRHHWVHPELYVVWTGGGALEATETELEALAYRILELLGIINYKIGMAKHLD